MANDIRASQKDIRESGFDAFLRELKPTYTGLDEARNKLSGRLDQQKSTTDISPQSDVKNNPDDIFAEFGYVDKQMSASLTRSEVDPKRDLFKEFGFNPKDMVIGFKKEPNIKDSKDLDVWDAFDEVTDDALYSRFRAAGPN